MPRPPNPYMDERQRSRLLYAVKYYGGTFDELILWLDDGYSGADYVEHLRQPRIVYDASSSVELSLALDEAERSGDTELFDRLNDANRDLIQELNARL